MSVQFDFIYKDVFIMHSETFSEIIPAGWLMNNLWILCFLQNKYINKPKNIKLLIYYRVVKSYVMCTKS